jgi:alpha-beta hydrolase superfamily lysophospholipase
MSDGSTAYVVAPETLAEGRPWLWRMRFFGAFPSVDLAMLEQGWAIGYVDIGGEFGGPKATARMDEFYQKAVEELSLSARPVIEGVSRGGLPAIQWSSANPEKVAGLYLDAPVMDLHSWPGKASPLFAQALGAYGFSIEEADQWKGPLTKLVPLADAGVPIFAVCGGADDVVPFAENTARLERAYRAAGGSIRVLVKAACGHHPHSLHEPAPLVEWLKGLL